MFTFNILYMCLYVCIYIWRVKYFDYIIKNKTHRNKQLWLSINKSIWLLNFTSKVITWFSKFFIFDPLKTRHTEKGRGASSLLGWEIILFVIWKTWAAKVSSIMVCSLQCIVKLNRPKKIPPPNLPADICHPVAIWNNTITIILKFLRFGALPLLHENHRCQTS